MRWTRPACAKACLHAPTRITTPGRRSFIETLNREMLQGGCFDSAHDARTEIFEYIEGYYNTHRKHSSLGYKTPIQFEAQIHSTN